MTPSAQSPFPDTPQRALPQTNCPHILRYLTTAVITNPRRRGVLKDLVRIIQQEHHTYRCVSALCLFGRGVS
eukprot:2677247-Rhodomonas_salina.1